MEKVTVYILRDGIDYSLVTSDGKDYGVVSDSLKNAIIDAKFLIAQGFADEYCIDE